MHSCPNDRQDFERKLEQETALITGGNYAGLSCCEERAARKRDMEAQQRELLALRELHVVTRDCLRMPEALETPSIIRTRLRVAVEAVDKLSN